MVNVGGSLPKKKKLLMEAFNNILPYSCEIWTGSIFNKQRKYCKQSVHNIKRNINKRRDF